MGRLYVIRNTWLKAQKFDLTNCMKITNVASNYCLWLKVPHTWHITHISQPYDKSNHSFVRGTNPINFDL